MRPHGYKPPVGESSTNRNNIISNLYGGQISSSSSNFSTSISSSTYIPSSINSSTTRTPSAAIHNQTLTIRNLQVKFPYDPYPCQRIFIEKVIEVLQAGQNALLESPTGTGKVSNMCIGREKYCICII